MGLAQEDDPGSGGDTGSGGDPGSGGCLQDLFSQLVSQRTGPGRRCEAEPPSPAGVHYVFDTTIAADFSILESQREFVRRYHQHSEEQPTLPMLTSACPGECQGQPQWLHLSEAPFTQAACGARWAAGELRGQ